MEDVIKRLKRGDLIEVYWFDASESRLPKNVSKQVPLPNHVIETRIRELGEFLTVQVGRFSREPWLIYTVKEVDEEPYITAVRLSDVYRIKVYEEKMFKKAGAQKTSIKGSPRLFRKKVQRFADGTVKYYRSKGRKKC